MTNATRRVGDCRLWGQLPPPTQLPLGQLLPGADMRATRMSAGERAGAQAAGDIAEMPGQGRLGSA